MKQIILFVLLVFSLNSCGQGRFIHVGPRVEWAKDKYDAKRKVASYKVINEIDRHGIKEVRSTYLNYTFSLEYFGYKLLNNNSRIQLLDPRGCLTVIHKEDFGTYKFLTGSYNLVIDVKQSGVYVTILNKGAVLKRSFM